MFLLVYYRCINSLSEFIESYYISDKVFKNGPRKICGRQPLKNLKGYGMLEQFLQILLDPVLNTLSYILHDFYCMISK